MGATPQLGAVSRRLTGLSVRHVMLLAQLVTTPAVPSTAYVFRTDINLIHIRIVSVAAGPQPPTNIGSCGVNFETSTDARTGYTCPNDHDALYRVMEDLFSQPEAVRLQER